MSERESQHGHWSSRTMFILAATGSAVGLGNIWKFPYMAGEFGGGVFVLFYIFCVAIIGIPIMMAEIMLGRKGRHSPINTMRLVAEDEGQSKWWQALGWMGVVAGFLILSFYSVIAGWTLAYVFRVASGLFEGQTAAGVGSIFSEFVSDPERLLFWHTAFMVLTVYVVGGGVRHGLERAVKYLMPALLIILLLMVGYAMNTGYFAQGVKFMFYPNFEALKAEGAIKDAILGGMGQAFFSLSLGMGAIMAYGAYLPPKTSIASAAISIALMDTLVALLAGLAIFPIIFANGLEPASGPGLIFKVLPIAFGQMPGGSIFGTLFFVLLVFAAWTSSISLVEPAVAYLVEKRGMSRRKAAGVCGVVAWLLGIFTVFSFNIWSDVHPLGMFAVFKDKTFFDLIDFLTSNVLLPLGGVLVAVFVAWLMKRETSCNELNITGATCGYPLWRLLTRYVSPVLVLIIFIVGLLRL
ncbi:MAG: sodium-dependent transporter [Gammaproteobacteria bacterium]|nr:MAG: sodium-dependent transporter [Gammaproteobacteria bacterium]